MLIRLLLIPAFICSMALCNVAHSEENGCPVRLYETGLYLGWGTALLEYTQPRQAPSPYDEVIYQQLQGAHNSLERAASACEDAIPAWPGWNQKQSYLLDKIEGLQSTSNHHLRRTTIYKNIASTYYSWGADLSIMEFEGRTSLQTTCATCYFRFGFSLAYAAQAFRQANEALTLNADVEEARRQMKLASGYLLRMQKVLGDYEDVQKPRGSIIILCCYLQRLDLKNRIASLLRYAEDPDNLAYCIEETNLMSSQLGDALKACPPRPGKGKGHEGSSGGNGGHQTFCEGLFCPQCDGQMVLLGEAVNRECQECLDGNKGLIAHCIDMESSPDLEKEASSSVSCPLKNEEGRSLVLEVDNTGVSEAQVKCSYSSDGLLTSQNPVSNGSKHGAYSEYKYYRTVHYLKRHGNYNNGSKDGVWKSYHFPNQAGKVVLASVIEYDNDVKLREEFYDSRDFLSKKIEYSNGKKKEVTAFYDSGRPSSHTVYNADGRRSSYKAWHRDGREK